MASALEGNEWLASRIVHFIPSRRRREYPFDRPGGTNSHFRGFGLETNRLRLQAVKPRFLDIPSCSLVTIAAKSTCVVLNCIYSIGGLLTVPQIVSLSTHSIGV